jgi:hypothetical protein
MNFSKNLNIIVPVIIVIVVITLYYSYYSVKDMVKSEIKDFYIKTEKIKLRRDKKEPIVQPQQPQIQNIQQVPYQMNQNQEPEFDMNDMSFLEMENEQINNVDIESYIDPLKNEEINDNFKKNDKESKTNQILADRIFNL